MPCDLRPASPVGACREGDSGGRAERGRPMGGQDQNSATRSGSIGTVTISWIRPALIEAIIR